MFSFHKPKIYRSNLGCCICKAKSSSSRFTDSKKYENEFEKCFRIQEKRSGEICNACVLLVKRWKKLSPENRLTKHWNHVVDARAGPGTKLTNGRRLTAASSSANSEGNSNRGAASCEQQQQDSSGSSSEGKRRSDILPLSSSQANNQTTSSGAQNSSSSSANNSNNNNNSCKERRFNVNKARAIESNISTFTFGEPIRRSYMLAESATTGYSSSSVPFCKPQSALNSSAFESVIKRFRQRQQQQQLEAQRRLLNRSKQKSSKQESFNQKQAGVINIDSASINATAEATDELNKRVVVNNKEGESKQQIMTASIGGSGSNNKRTKRSSECISSLFVDGMRVSSLLDGSLWRKERICCGIIFRGINNEVAVFPKLLKPCHCRTEKLKLRRNEQQQRQITSALGSTKNNTKAANNNNISSLSESRRIEEEQEVLSAAEDSSVARGSLATPRAFKSGSISSCDSSTSGTGSMEQQPIASRDQEFDVGLKQRLLPGSTTTQRQRRSGKAALSIQHQALEVSQQRNRKQPLRRRNQIVTTGGANRSSNVVADTTSVHSRSTRKLRVRSSPPSSSRASTSRLHLMMEDDIFSNNNDDDIDREEEEESDEEIDGDDEGEEVDEDEEDEGEEEEEEDDDDEEEEEEEEKMSLESLEDEERNTSDSVIDSLANVERKQSTVGAIG